MWRSRSWIIASWLRPTTIRHEYASSETWDIFPRLAVVTRSSCQWLFYYHLPRPNVLLWTWFSGFLALVSFQTVNFIVKIFQKNSNIFDVCVLLYCSVFCFSAAYILCDLLENLRLIRSTQFHPKHRPTCWQLWETTKPKIANVYGKLPNDQSILTRCVMTPHHHHCGYNPLQLYRIWRRLSVVLVVSCRKHKVEGSIRQRDRVILTSVKEIYGFGKKTFVFNCEAVHNSVTSFCRHSLR